MNKLRNLMERDGVGAYIVTSSDFHNSEYTGSYFETRKFFSGFTGSAGTLVVGKEKAALYTDGRYFIQAEKELLGSGITLMKMGEPDTVLINEYIASLVNDGSCIGVDTRTITAKEGITFEKIAEVKHVDYAEILWEDRPCISDEKAFELDIKYCGRSRHEKISDVRKCMKDADADAHILTTLDDIAWLLNIRGNDILYNPMVLAYLYMDFSKVILFADKNKFSDVMIENLNADGIEIYPYNKIYDFIKNITEQVNVLYDINKINYAIYINIGENIKRIEKQNPEILMKAIKNPVEIENLKKAHIKDGIAVTKFIYRMKNAIKEQEFDEVTAAECLEKFRMEQDGYIEPSFSTISAYNENAAMMHYNPYNGEPAKLYPKGILLVDSGGQYYEGTTDITRTIALGPVKEEVKTHYTAVLRGMLNLSAAKFLYGCIGMNLDILARGPLWEMGIDYKCGTGHGVGYLLGVHEAPNGFRWRKVPERDDGCIITPGMVTTNEPGVYIEGSHGIRIENELLTVFSEKNEYGEFLEFETLTFVPIDMDMVDFEQMSAKEIDLLRKYSENVYEKISFGLDENEKMWLKNLQNIIP